MAADPLDSLRLALMQEVLPVGMAVVERARRGGAKDVVEAFTTTADPLGQLKQEGDAAARSVRDGLDRLQPGLGNPVMKVSVETVPDAPADAASPELGASDHSELQRTLGRIAERLVVLDQRLAAEGA
jgi:hypothetical protein